MIKKWTFHQEGRITNLYISNNTALGNVKYKLIEKEMLSLDPCRDSYNQHPNQDTEHVHYSPESPCAPFQSIPTLLTL